MTNLLAILVLACMNVTRTELDAHTRLVKAAATALEDEEITKAAQTVERIPMFATLYRRGAEGIVGYPDGKGVEAPYNGLITRARRVYALAKVRTKGTSLDDRKFAIHVLREIHTKAPEPTIQADLAEAMAAVEDTEPAALMVLRELSNRDLIGSPHAYAALARLEATRGEPALEQAARDRCRTMSKKPAICARPK